MIHVEPKAIDFLHWQTQDGGHPPRVRLIVQGGGCAGYRYDFVFGDEAEADDVIIDLQTSQNEKLQFIMHPEEHALIQNSTIGFDEDEFSFGLTVRMPSSYSRCGCGSSFSPPEEA